MVYITSLNTKEFKKYVNSQIELKELEFAYSQSSFLCCMCGRLHTGKDIIKSVEKKLEKSCEESYMLVLNIEALRENNGYLLSCHIYGGLLVETDSSMFPIMKILETKGYCIGCGQSSLRDDGCISLVIISQMPRSKDFYPPNFNIVTKEGFRRIVLKREFNASDNADSIYIWRS